MGESNSVRVIKDITAGTFGGISICLVGHPFDTVKVRLQTQQSSNRLYAGVFDCVKKTYQWEGLGGFYKGVGSPIVGQMFFRAIMFSGYGQSLGFWERWTGKKQMPIRYYFYAGCMTGIYAAFVEGPIDLFKSQVQVDILRVRQHNLPAQYKNVFQCARTIYSQYGIRGCYQGLGACIFRNSIASSFFFGFNEATRRFLAGDKPVSELATSQLLLAGGVGGFLYWFSTYPIDVVKSSMQGDAIDPKNRKYSSVIHCAKTLYKENGWRRFTQGLSPCLMRSIPANAVMWTVYEKIRSLLG